MRDYLRNGYELKKAQQASLIIEEVIGEGASCIAYKAYYKDTGAGCIVKEYNPLSMGLKRDLQGNLIVEEHAREKFEIGRSLFEDGLERQRDIRKNPGTMNQTQYVIEQFFENNTIYAVSVEYTGVVYTNNKSKSLYDRINVCKSVVAYVKSCHEMGYLCLDIKPDNIFVLPETDGAMFFDFDSVRRSEEIQNDSGFSYTISWAAPEQLIPSKHEHISEATDIYILGELIFWSLFDRHSKDDEHRSFSMFEYDESPFYDQLTDKSQSIFSELFHNTLRSSARGRYKRAEELARKLDELLKELYPYNEKLVNLPPPQVDFFVGREKEMKRVREYLDTFHRVFLTGIGGVGKSGIARVYAHQSAQRYKYIIHIPFEYELVQSLKKVKFISECEKEDRETDKHYCERKLTKLAELGDKNTLLIIDDLNLSLSDQDTKEIWQRIISLPIDLLVTTRQTHDDYKNQSIRIEAMQDDELEALFDAYCPYAESCAESVKEIIETAGRHTLVIELISKQAKVAHLNPEEMLERLRKNGILGFGRDRVRWNLNDASVAEHVRKLFDISCLSEQQMRVMNYLAFMPHSGIHYKDFYTFFEMQDNNDLQQLTVNGWIEQTGDALDLISMHPIIGDVVIAALCEDNDSLDRIYTFASDRMNKKIEQHEIDQNECFAICNSLAEKTIQCKIKTHNAADYLLRFMDRMGRYVAKSRRRDIMRFAMDVYNDLYLEGEYAFVREYAYYRSVPSNYAHMEKKALERFFKKHYMIAKQAADYYMEALWTSELMRFELDEKSSVVGHFKWARRFYRLFKKICKEMMIEPERYLSLDNLNRLHFGYHIGNKNTMPTVLIQEAATGYERAATYVFYANQSDQGEAVLYENAIRLRNILSAEFEEASKISSDNGRKIIWDRAKIDIWSGNYSSAMKKIDLLKNYYENNDHSVSLSMLMVYKYLGEIALILGEFDVAVTEFREMLAMDPEGKWGNHYDVKIGLARALYYLEETYEADEINRALYDEFRDVNAQHLVAETYYNFGCKYFVFNEPELMTAYLTKAISGFNLADEKHDDRNITARCMLGRARCYKMGGEAYYRFDPIRGKGYLKEALNYYSRSVGEKHIEACRCKELLIKQ